MGIKVCKFGGSSIADGKAVKAVSEIVLKDETRRYVLPSAPGKRFAGDTKVTDLLYSYYRFSVEGDKRSEKSFDELCARFEEIASPFGLSAYASNELFRLKKRAWRCGKDYCASRGEWLTAKILSKGWDMPFLDAEELPLFRGDAFDGNCFSAVKRALQRYPKAVIPAFYGVNERGEVKTFSRGGGDVSGAVLARAAEAEVYENWTDVGGVYACDPAVLRKAKHIPELSYKELAEFSYAGACVLHGETLSVLQGSTIPIRILNTFAPQLGGTTVSPYEREKSPFLGVVGQEDFSSKIKPLSKIALIGRAQEAHRRRLFATVKKAGAFVQGVGIRPLSVNVVVEKRFYRRTLKEIYKEFFG